MVRAMTQRDKLDAGLSRLDRAAALVSRHRAYYAGTQPAAFLAAKVAASLDARLRSLSINLPRLYTSTVAERLDLMGYTDETLSELWRAAGGPRVAPQVHTDRLAVGAAYVTVWGGVDGSPRLSVDAGDKLHAEVDPLTGGVLWAVRRWADGDNAYSTLMEPDRVTVWRAPAGSDYAGSHWTHVRTVENGLDAVPVVPFVRRPSSMDPATGTPLPADIYDLTDAICKVTADALTTSEYFARPRRWATGLEIELDDDGKAVDPFGDSRLLQSEDPDTKFGQLDPPSMAGYTDLLRTLLGQVGAITGLPAGLLGIGSDVPSSAEALAAGENALVQRADTEQKSVDEPWQRVAVLLRAVDKELPLAAVDRAGTVPVWADTQSRTPAQDADAAAKLRAIGVPLRELLISRLRYTPAEADAIAADAERAQLLASLGNR